MGKVTGVIAHPHCGKQQSIKIANGLTPIFSLARKILAKGILFLLGASLIACSQKPSEQVFEWRYGQDSGIQGWEIYELGDTKKSGIQISCWDNRDIPVEISYWKDGKEVDARSLQYTLDGEPQEDRHIDGDCRACEANFIYFWDKLKKAKSITVHHGKSQDTFVVNGGVVIPPLSGDACKTASAHAIGAQQADSSVTQNPTKSANIDGAAIQDDWNFMIGMCVFGSEENIEQCTPESVEDQVYPAAAYKIFGKDRMTVNVIIGKKFNDQLPSPKPNIRTDYLVEYVKSSTPNSVIAKTTTQKGCIVTDEFSMVGVDLFETGISMTGNCEDAQKMLFEGSRNKKTKMGYLKSQ